MSKCINQIISTGVYLAGVVYACNAIVLLKNFAYEEFQSVDFFIVMPICIRYWGSIDFIKWVLKCSLLFCEWVYIGYILFLS